MREVREEGENAGREFGMVKATARIDLKKQEEKEKNYA